MAKANGSGKTLLCNYFTPCFVQFLNSVWSDLALFVTSEMAVISVRVFLEKSVYAQQIYRGEIEVWKWFNNVKLIKMPVFDKCPQIHHEYQLKSLKAICLLWRILHQIISQHWWTGFISLDQFRPSCVCERVCVCVCVWLRTVSLFCIRRGGCGESLKHLPCFCVSLTVATISDCGYQGGR